MPSETACPATRQPEADCRPAAPPLIEARSLHKAYGPVRALRGVSLVVGAGEIVALFGPNGAGKSTLIRCLASLARPDAGTVLVGGSPLAGGGAAALRSRIGLVGHQTFLYDSLTAEENLVFHASLHGVRAPVERARALLGEFGLLERAGDAVRALSRGMQQRLALARALVHAPEILLLDEPVTGLDPSAAEAFAARLGRFRRSGGGALIASHDIASALELADRYVVLRSGRLAETGQASEAAPLRLTAAHFAGGAPAGAGAKGTVV